MGYVNGSRKQTMHGDYSGFKVSVDTCYIAYLWCHPKTKSWYWRAKKGTLGPQKVRGKSYTTYSAASWGNPKNVSTLGCFGSFSWTKIRRRGLNCLCQSYTSHILRNSDVLHRMAQGLSKDKLCHQRKVKEYSGLQNHESLVQCTVDVEKLEDQ